MNIREHAINILNELIVWNLSPDLAMASLGGPRPACNIIPKIFAPLHSHVVYHDLIDGKLPRNKLMTKNNHAGYKYD